MHERHKRALNAVRKRFRAARNDLSLHINAYEVARESYHRPLDSPSADVRAAVLRQRQRHVGWTIQALQDAIERYQEAGDILVTVERLLEKA